MKLILEFYSLLNKKNKIKSILFIFFIIISTVLETLSIGSIFPLLIYILSPTSIDNYSFLRPIFNYLEQFSYDLTFLLIVIIFFSFILKASFQLALSYFQSKFLTGISKNFASKLLEGYLNHPYIYHLNNNSSFLIRNIINEVNFLNNHIDTIQTLIAELFIVIGLLLLLIIIKPLEVTGALFLMGIISFSFIFLFRNLMERWGQIRQRNEGFRIKYLQQIFQSIKDIKMGSLEKSFVFQFDKPNTEIANVNAKFFFLKSTPKIIIELILISICCSAILLFLNLKVEIIDILPIFGILSVVAYRVLPSINKIILGFTAISMGRAVVEMLKREFKSFENNKSKTYKKSFEKINNSIELKNIDFAYDNESKKIIEGLSLKLERGKIYGIAGDSGTGKSTFVDVFSGLLESSNGQFKIDSIIFEPQNNKWMEQISYVPQNVSLIDDTIKSNIALGIEPENVDINKIKAVMKIVDLTSMLLKLPDGIETIIGERGAKISGGQKQRIGIARALYKNYEVLILDESTSALDNETEKNVLKNIFDLNKNKIIIFVTHKRELLKLCHEVLRFKNNKLLPVNNNSSKN